MFRGVPGCSGMFRHVPECSVFRVLSTANCKNVFLQRHFQMFSNKSVFQSEPEVLPCFELNYKFLERHEKPLSLVTTRKQENPVNTAQKMASKSSTKQDGEATIHGLTFTISRYLPYINRDVKLSVLSLGHFISFSLEQMIWKFEKIIYR